ncbi:MAG: hypothetical protein ABR511_13165 [Acidimicrobiales bacterium]
MSEANFPPGPLGQPYDGGFPGTAGPDPPPWSGAGPAFSAGHGPGP